MIKVTCDNDSCVHYCDGSCGKDSISIGSKTFSGFASGEREWSTVCTDYKEADDGLYN